MAFKLLDAVTAVKASPAVKLPKNTRDHTTDVSFLSTGDTAISAVTAILQGSSTGEDAVTGVITNPTIAIDSTATRYANAAFTYLIKGTTYSKAGDSGGNTFTAAHVIGNGSDDLWGVINIYINSSGTLISKVPIATQVYTSAALAITASDNMLALPFSELCYVGRILINANAKTWTANTDDMTDGSDVTTADFFPKTSSFADLDTHAFSAAEITAKRAMFHTVNKPARYVRVYLSALTGTGQVTARYMPYGG